MDSYALEKLANLAERSGKERRRFLARRPKAARDVVANVIAKRGYAASQAADDLASAWKAVAQRVLGDAAIAGQTRVAGLKRGRLEVTVANHVVMQEINFQRPALLAALQAATPDARIGSIRFQVGRI